MFERPGLGVSSDETFLSGNVGGGVLVVRAEQALGTPRRLSLCGDEVEG